MVGGLDRDEVSTVVRSSTAALQRCRASTRSATVSRRRGAIHLSLHISTTGRVTRAEVLPSRRPSKKFQQCLLKIARRWRFPANRTEPTVVKLAV